MCRMVSSEVCTAVLRSTAQQALMRLEAISLSMFKYFPPPLPLLSLKISGMGASLLAACGRRGRDRSGHLQGRLADLAHQFPAGGGKCAAVELLEEGAIAADPGQPAA